MTDEVELGMEQKLALALRQKRLQYPSLRMGQIIANIAPGGDPYYLGDQELVQRVRDYEPRTAQSS